MEDTKDKEEDINELYKDEIEEMKENLERKEYLLQAAEHRYSQYEKLLISYSETDKSLAQKLNELQLVPKDRKISNVIQENAI